MHQSICSFLNKVSHNSKTIVENTELVKCVDMVSVQIIYEEKFLFSSFYSLQLFQAISIRQRVAKNKVS